MQLHWQLYYSTVFDSSIRLFRCLCKKNYNNFNNCFTHIVKLKIQNLRKLEKNEPG